MWRKYVYFGAVPIVAALAALGYAAKRKLDAYILALIQTTIANTHWEVDNQPHAAPPTKAWEAWISAQNNQGA